MGTVSLLPQLLKKTKHPKQDPRTELLRISACLSWTAQLRDV